MLVNPSLLQVRIYMYTIFYTWSGVAVKNPNSIGLWQELSLQYWDSSVQRTDQLSYWVAMVNFEKAFFNGQVLHWLGQEIVVNMLYVPTCIFHQIQNVFSADQVEWIAKNLCICQQLIFSLIATKIMIRAKFQIISEAIRSLSISLCGFDHVCG